jgi:hypothetical protein
MYEVEYKMLRRTLALALALGSLEFFPGATPDRSQRPHVPIRHWAESTAS